MKIAIAALLAAVLAGAAGFYGGVTFQKTQTPAGFAGRGTFPGGRGGDGQGFPGGMRGGGRFPGGSAATGTVLAQDASSITVKLATGGAKTVIIDSNTRITRMDTLTLADLKVGDPVAAFGADSGGVITARSVQVLPPGGDFRPGGGPAGD
jgi:hypothetical protein